MEVTQITSGYSMMSSLSLGVYFQIAVVVVGLVGIAANSLILYGLVASKQHKKHVLIVNQNVLDLFSCIFLTASSAVKLCNIRLTGSLGYWLCVMLYSDVFTWCGTMGSTINLASITIERYLKVVHAVWSKKKLRSWMIYLAVAFAWIGPTAYNLAIACTTAVVKDGECIVYLNLETEAARLTHVLWYFISFYVIILIIFTLGYWRILVVIRRQARVMAGHSAAGSSTGQTQSSHIQTNVIKTMILVSVFFAITQLPNHIFYVTVNVNPNIPLYEVAYFLTLFLAFLYICTNPFIYATKFDPVKQALLHLIPCKKVSDQPNDTN